MKGEVVKRWRFNVQRSTFDLKGQAKRRAVGKQYKGRASFLGFSRITVVAVVIGVLTSSSLIFLISVFT